MGKLDKIVEAMRTGPTGVRYTDLFKVCEHYFGDARQSGSSHAVFRTPWQGDPRVNIQKTMARPRPTRSGKSSQRSPRSKRNRTLMGRPPKNKARRRSRDR